MALEVGERGLGVGHAKLARMSYSRECRLRQRVVPQARHHYSDLARNLASVTPCSANETKLRQAWQMPTFRSRSSIAANASA